MRQARETPHTQLDAYPRYRVYIPRQCRSALVLVGTIASEGREPLRPLTRGFILPQTQGILQLCHGNRKIPRRWRTKSGGKRVPSKLDAARGIRVRRAAVVASL